jgi:hypothetical protein
MQIALDNIWYYIMKEFGLWQAFRMANSSEDVRYLRDHILWRGSRLGDGRQLCASLQNLNVPMLSR